MESLSGSSTILSLGNTPTLPPGLFPYAAPVPVNEPYWDEDIYDRPFLPPIAFIFPEEPSHPENDINWDGFVFSDSSGDWEDEDPQWWRSLPLETPTLYHHLACGTPYGVDGTRTRTNANCKHQVVTSF